jgi:hypothetical protein
MPEPWFQRFQSSFSEHLRENHDNIVARWDTAPLWTEVMRDAVAEASRAAFGGDAVFASRGRRDGFKCEYLSVDCTFHDNSWGRPTLMVELENDPRQLEYSAWKLLCARPTHRLVIGYFFQEVDEVIPRLREVTGQHPDEAIHFLLAPWARPAQTRDLWKTHYELLFARGDLLKRVPPTLD